MCIPLPFCPKIGFGMNDASKPELLRHVLHDEPERRDVVRRLQRVGVAEVDLVLAVRDLVVRRLDLESHLLEHVHDRAPRVLAEVHRREIEVRADVVRLGRRLAVRPALEHEELGFHPRVHRVAHARRASAITRFSAPRGSPANGVAVGHVDVADQPRDAILRIAPRKDRNVVEVGREQHVRLLDPHEPLDRRAVEHDVAGERLLELRRRDLDVLVDAEDVGELQAQEADVVLPGELEDVLRRSRPSGRVTSAAWMVRRRLTMARPESSRACQIVRAAVARLGTLIARSPVPAPIHAMDGSHASQQRGRR